MYYRVAIQRSGKHPDQLPNWQWKSTILSSLEALFQFLRLYGALRHDDLRVFSSCSREGLEEQLLQENLGLGSPSTTAAYFLHERLIRFPPGKRARPEQKREMSQQRVSIAVVTHPFVNENSREGNNLVGEGLSALERRRLEQELGPGGDHDVPYRFILPPVMQQVLAWMRLLARMQRGELLS